MPTVEDLTDPYAASFTPPPAARVGVCEVCHSWTGTMSDGERYRLCSGCDRTVSAVPNPVRVVVPISLVAVGSQFYSVLSGYKNSQSERAREIFQLRAGALLARFLRDHGDDVRRAVDNDWNVMTIVPSSRDRPGIHPLEMTVKLARAHKRLYERLLEPTGVEVDHRSADERAYRTTGRVEGKKVLLIDDTFTSGARVQSGASALATAGAEVVAVVALGRVVRPDFTPEAQELWDRQKAIPFDFDVCCLEP